MKDNTPLKTLVDLYRMAGRPAIDGLHLTLSLSYSSEAKNLLTHFMSASYFQEFIAEDELYIDGIEMQDIRLPDAWSEIELTVKLPRDSVHRFHNSITEFIKFPSVRNGDFPQDFFICDENYYSVETNTPSAICKAESICKLIKSLSKLAHYHDKKATDGEPRLVFILESEGRSKSALLQPIITNEMLAYTDVDCSIVEQLQDDFSAHDVNHHVEKRGIFRNTLVEFVNDNGYDFEQLIKNWSEFRLAYDNNLSIYLSGFSFHKSRKEVAAAELEFAEKTSKTITELTTKIFAIPISLLASVGLWKIDNLTEQLVILSGITFTSIIINLIILNQSKQLRRIIHSRDMVFSPFLLKLKNYPTDLQNDISGATVELNKNESFSKRVLFFFYLLCWIPTVAGIVIIYLKYNPIA